MKIKLTKVSADDIKRLKDIENLYIRSFPKEERKPFDVIKAKADDGSMETLAAESENGSKFLGLAISVMHKDLVLLDYFAVCENSQGTGVGTAALDLLMHRYKKSRFFLEIESPDPNAKNAVQRARRKKFYLNCGMCETKVYVSLFGIDMELLTDGCSVKFSEYFELYNDVFGKKISDNVLERT